METKLPRIDKKAITVTTLNDHSEEDAYWQSKSYEERLNGMETNRRLVYGDGTASRLQRLLEVAELPRG